MTDAGTGKLNVDSIPSSADDIFASSPDPWDAIRDRFDEVQALVADDPHVVIAYGVDAMDDSERVVFRLRPTAFQPTDHPEGAAIQITARRFWRRRVELEGYFDLKKNLNRKGKVPSMRLRQDAHKLEAFEGNFSTDHRAVFPPDGRLVFDLATCQRLLLEVRLMHAGPFIGTFDPGLHQQALGLFLRVAFGEHHQRLMKLPRKIVQEILLWGPRFTTHRKEGLRELGLYSGPIDPVRDLALFEAATAYAQSRHAAEIFGYLEPGGRGVNSSWGQLIYNEVSPGLRSRMGPLRIND